MSGEGEPSNEPFETEVSKVSTSSTTQFIHNSSLRNSSQSLEDDVEFYYFYKEEQLTFLWILFATIVIGNSSVLIQTFLRSNNRRSRMNFFIMHLAFADLLVGLINVLTDIIWKTTVGFYGGDIVCRLVKFLQVLVTYSSTYVLVSLSIDRFDAIKNPLNFSRRWKRARLLIIAAWSLSVLFSMPAIFLNEVTIIKGRPQCWITLEPWQWRVYISLVATSLFVIPAVIIAACYSIIVTIIWRKGRAMSSFPKTSSKTSSSVATTGFGTTTTSGAENTATTSISRQAEQEADFKRASSRGVIPRAKIKSVKMTLVIVFVFIICWSPYFVWDLLQVYGYIPVSQSTIAISTFIQSLAPLNSAANPIIYYLFTTHFCRSIR